MLANTKLTLTNTNNRAVLRPKSTYMIAKAFDQHTGERTL